MTRKTKVFISYAHSDLAFVERLVKDLIQNDEGLDIWYDKLLRVDDDWQKELRNHMAASDYCVVVLSQNVYSEGAFQSKWVLLEIEWALAYEVDRHRPVPFRIFPIRLDGCDIPPQLRHKQCADFSQDYQHGLDQLVFRLLSLEKYRSLFVNRRKELDQCLEMFRFLSNGICSNGIWIGGARIIYHKKGQKRMGSTFMLRYLEDRIPFDDRIPFNEGNRPIPIFFGPKDVTDSMGWLYILDHTVQRAGEEHFQTYLHAREFYMRSDESVTRPAQRPAPESAHDIQPTGDMRAIELLMRRYPLLTGLQSSSRATNNLDRREEVSGILTTIFLKDLERAPIPGVVWLIDGPPRPQWTGPKAMDHMMHDWLKHILCEAAVGHLPKLGVITAGQYSPIPPADPSIPNDVYCPLGEFDRQAVEEYLDRRLPTSDTRYRAMVAIAVLHWTRHPAKVCAMIEELIREAALE